MRIFGLELFEGFLQDPEELAFRLEREGLRRERIKRQCELWGTQDTNAVWDIIELPRGLFIKDSPAKEDVKEHKALMKKQECHIFYGKKYCYHQGSEVVTEINNIKEEEAQMSDM